MSSLLLGLAPLLAAFPLAAAFLASAASRCAFSALSRSSRSCASLQDKCHSQF